MLFRSADHETGGLNATSGTNDFSTITNIGFNFTTTAHTATLVPIYAYGTGAKYLAGIYDNTHIFYKLLELLRWKA